jgi:two-component system NarL family sensor kinase
MDPDKIFILVLTGSILLVIFIGFFIATVIQNQKRFIKVQREKLMESERLQEVLRERPRQIIHTQEEERKRVARDLHDGISQVLASIMYKLHAMKARLSKQGEQPLSIEVTHLADDITNDLNQALEELKRIAHNLRPKLFDELGFDASVRSLLNLFQERTHITCEYIPENAHSSPGQSALPQEIALGLFRIIQEALNNVEKHAGATSIVVQSINGPSGYQLTIVDNGKGIDTGSLTPPSPAKNSNYQGMGLISMKERANLLGGTCVISRNTPTGTKIVVDIPI